MILDNLVKKEDVKNCSNASPFFRKILQKKRERLVVLPEVWAILGERFVDENNRDESYMEPNLDHVPWTIRPGRVEPTRLTGILKCRHVSKSWNAAIQKFFEDGNKLADKYNWDSKFYRFNKLNWSHQNFLHHFDVSHKIELKANPFLGRGIKIVYYDQFLDIPPLNIGVLEMARKYGEHIWYLQLEDIYFNWGSMFDQFYLRLIEIVRLMPNLKSLLLKCLTHGPENETALEQVISDNPFPKLENLESIEIEIYVPPSIFHQIIHKNLHVTRLAVRRDRMKPYMEYPVLVENFPNLQELCLDFSSLVDFEEFEKYPFPLNLKKVELRFRPNPTLFVLLVPWSRVFYALKNKLNTELCTHLLLELPEPVTKFEEEMTVKESHYYSLDLPNLQTITICNRVPCFLEFLLPAKKSLSHITLQDRRDLEYEHEDYEMLVEEQVIKFIGHQHNTAQSNISNIRTQLQRLKTLTVNKTRYEFGLDGGVKITENE